MFTRPRYSASHPRYPWSPALMNPPFHSHLDYDCLTGCSKLAIVMGVPSGVPYRDSPEMKGSKGKGKDRQSKGSGLK